MLLTADSWCVRQLQRRVRRRSEAPFRGTSRRVRSAIERLPIRLNMEMRRITSSSPRLLEHQPDAAAVIARGFVTETRDARGEFRRRRTLVRGTTHHLYRAGHGYSGGVDNELHCECAARSRGYGARDKLTRPAADLEFEIRCVRGIAAARCARGLARVRLLQRTTAARSGGCTLTCDHCGHCE
jgi:hypothetical protein